MNQDTSLEDRLEALGGSLRTIPSLTDRVMKDIREFTAGGTTDEPLSLARPSVLETFSAPRRRRHLLAALGAIATVGAAVFVAALLFPSSSVGWADVIGAIQKQKWIRGTSKLADGKDVTIWLSPQAQIWAIKFHDSCQFFSGPEQVKYEFRVGTTSVTKFPLNEADAARVLSMNALSEDPSAIGRWLMHTERVVSQERREVTDEGKTWIEFQMKLSGGETTLATLRVDPGTSLPAYFVFVGPKKTVEGLKTVERLKWTFDYPASGPGDIYALDVPRDTKIDDHTPSENALAALHAMTKSRRSIGDFRLLVGEYRGVESCYVVWRKGDRWREDWYWNQGYVDAAASPPADGDWSEWFEQRLKRCVPISLFICDGKAVWKNVNPRRGVKPQWEMCQKPTPQDLMSGEGQGGLPVPPLNAKIASLLFPDLSPRPGQVFQFNPAPMDAAGCILIKRSAQLATAERLVGHEWYYVDPAKGHAVIRVEAFNGPSDSPDDRKDRIQSSSVVMEDFVQTPRGFWYPRIVHSTMPVAPPDTNGVGEQTLKQMKTTIRYHFDFTTGLPDSLFFIDGTQVSM